jgi:uncharacterized protein YkwD
MARIRIFIAIALATCALAAMAMASSAAASSPEAQMLQKVNKYRRHHGLGAIRLSRDLARSAKRKARRMMDSGYFGHDDRIHASSRFRRLGEILEWQRGGTNVALCFRTWIRSGPHRAIILDRYFNYAGAAHVYGWYRGHKTTMWAMHFGRP